MVKVIIAVPEKMEASKVLLALQQAMPNIKLLSTDTHADSIEFTLSVSSDSKANILRKAISQIAQEQNTASLILNTNDDKFKILQPANTIIYRQEITNNDKGIKLSVNQYNKGIIQDIHDGDYELHNINKGTSNITNNNIYKETGTVKASVNAYKTKLLQAVNTTNRTDATKQRIISTTTDTNKIISAKIINNIDKTYTDCKITKQKIGFKKLTNQINSKKLKLTNTSDKIKIIEQGHKRNFHNTNATINYTGAAACRYEKNYLGIRGHFRLAMQSSQLFIGTYLNINLGAKISQKGGFNFNYEVCKQDKVAGLNYANIEKTKDYADISTQTDKYLITKATKINCCLYKH